MLNGLREADWTNYSLFLDRDDGPLFGYFESPDLDATRAGIVETELNARWQEVMGPCSEWLEGMAPDEGFKDLQAVFYLK